MMETVTVDGLPPTLTLPLKGEGINFVQRLTGVTTTTAACALQEHICTSMKF